MPSRDWAPLDPYGCSASAITVGSIPNQLRSMTQRQWVTALMRELKPNTELFRVPLVITGPNPKIDMDIEGATYVAIGPGLSVVNQVRCHRQHGQAYPRSLRTRLRPADSQADMERATMARGRAAPAPREYPCAATERHPTVDEASPRHLDSLPSGPYISVSWAQTCLLFAGQICAKSGLIESGMVALLFAVRTPPGVILAAVWFRRYSSKTQD